MTTVMIEMSQAEAVHARAAIETVLRNNRDAQALETSAYVRELLKDRIDSLTAASDTLSAAINACSTEILVQRFIDAGCTYQEAKELAA